MKKFLKIAIASISVLGLFVASIGFFGFRSLKAEAKIDVKTLPQNGPATVVTDSFGGEIFKFESYVTLAEMPENLINAFIAVEDKRFYSHGGVDYKRVAGAIIKNLKAKKMAEGASTITQQLVKNTQLTSEKTFERKINEMAIAQKMETVYDKNQILEMYLNVIYLGGGNYGVQSAAKYYFGKKVSDLSLSECATIAGITKNPSRFNPKNNPKSAKNRRNLILDLMKAQGYISETELDSAKRKPLKTVTEVKNNFAPYVREATFEAAKILGITEKQLTSGGYVVKTYFDPISQKAADDGIKNSPGAESVVMILSNETSGIIALASTSKTEVRKLRRQIASTAKPILVYGPAIEQGLISLATPIKDEPTSFSGYSPRNFNDRYYGTVSAKLAISKSLNVPAVKILSEMGTETALSYAKKLGLPLTEKDNNLSLALGGLTEGLTLSELSGAYMTLANLGEFSTPSYVSEISLNGTVLYSHAAEKTPVFSPETAYFVGEALSETAKTGTAKKLAALNIPIYAKTGTNSVNGKNLDAYSVAYTSKHTAVCWRGNSDNSALSQTDTGGNFAIESLVTVFSELYDRFSPSPIEKPAGILKTKFDLTDFENGNLTLAAPNTPEGYFFEEYVSVRNLPSYQTSANFLAPTLDGLTVTSDGNDASVSFFGKKPFVYQIYSVDVFGREELLFEANGQNELQNYAFSIGFLKNYYIKCGFIDYFGVAVWGEPEKIAVYSGFNIFS